MKTRTFHRRCALAACALITIILGLAWASPARAQTSFSGRAFAASVTTPLTGTLVISDTGELSPSGGSRNETFLDTRDLGLAPVNNVLTAEVLPASTSGASGKAESSASLANVVVLPGNQAQVTASFLRAESQATCSAASGSSEIAELTFGGQKVAVTGEPNQTVAIPGVATLIINEQTTSTNGTHRQITVNAVHVIVPGVADVILASTESDINCIGPTGQGPCHDFVSGGGWITAGKSRGNFGFHAGMKAGALLPDGHLNYIDHGTGMKVKGTDVDVYDDRLGSRTRHIEGLAEVDGSPGHRYFLDVTDMGEPGRDDFFSLTVDKYHAEGTLQGGNIKLHKPCS